MKAAKQGLEFVLQYSGNGAEPDAGSAESEDLEEENELQLENVKLMISNARTTSQILTWAREHQDSRPDEGEATSTALLEKGEGSASSSGSSGGALDMGFSSIDKNAIAVAPVGWKVRGANRVDGQHSYIVSSGTANIPKLSQRVPLVGAEIYDGHAQEKNEKRMVKAAAEAEAHEFKPATIVNGVDHWPTQYLGRSESSVPMVQGHQDGVEALSRHGVHANNV